MADDAANSKRTGVNPDLLKLPIGARATGDPVNGNPFPPGTTRHDIWHRATREAEEMLARIQAAHQTAVTAQNQMPPYKLVGLGEDRKRECELHCFEFDVWALRTIQVVSSDADITANDEWLTDYAEFLLKAVSELWMSDGIPLAANEARLLRLREMLVSSVNRWKAEARARVTKRNSADGGSRPKATQEAKEPPNNVGGPKLAAWLKAEMRKRDSMTVNRLHELTELDRQTIKKMLAGKSVRAVRLDKLVRGLSIDVSDIPTD